MKRPKGTKSRRWARGLPYAQRESPYGIHMILCPASLGSRSYPCIGRNRARCSGSPLETHRVRYRMVSSEPPGRRPMAPTLQQRRDRWCGGSVRGIKRTAHHQHRPTPSVPCWRTGHPLRGWNWILRATSRNINARKNSQFLSQKDLIAPTGGGEVGFSALFRSAPGRRVFERVPRAQSSFRSHEAIR